VFEQGTMRPLHIVWPGRAESHVVPARVLMLLAAVVAAGLLTGYVRLLNDSVARGVQWRAEQHLLSAKPVAKLATLAPARVVGRAAD
jgi:hypothetical protein